MTSDGGRMRSTPLMIAATCGVLSFASVRRSRRQDRPRTDAHVPILIERLDHDRDALEPAMSLLSTPTELVLPRRRALMLFVPAVFGAAGFAMAVSGSAFSPFERMACVVAGTNLVIFVLAIGPRHMVWASRTDHHASHRWQVAMRWANTAAPRLGVIGTGLTGLLLGYWATEVLDLNDRDLGVMTNVIAAGYTVIGVALSDVILSHRRRVKELRQQHGPRLHLLLVGEELPVSEIATLFVALSEAPKSTAHGILDPERAEAAIEIYRATRSPSLLRPLVIEALSCS